MANEPDEMPEAHRNSTGPLQPADAELVRHAVAGTECDLRARSPDQRRVSTSVLYELCVGDRWQVHAKGVWLIGAVFMEALDFENAVLRVPLVLDSCEINGAVRMSWANIPRLGLAKCQLWVVDLHGATIAGPLNMEGAKLTGMDSDGDSLTADLLRVGGSAFLGEGFQAAGGIRLAGAAIENRLVLRDAKLPGTGKEYSLAAGRMRVASDVHLDGVFHAARSIRLLGANIEGHLVLRGARIAGSDDDGDSLVADRIRVGGSAFLDGGFQPEGCVRLVGANIEGRLCLTNSRLTGGLTLDAAKCHELDVTGLASPPPEGHLVLRDFEFSALGGDASWRRQLEWIRRQGFESGWSPAPYEQLAAWYTRIGDEDAARRVRVSRGDDQLKHLRKTNRWRSLGYRAWRRPLGWLVGYGYRRHRAGLLLVVTIALAGLVFQRAETERAMAPSDPDVYENGRPLPCGGAYPCFNPWVYGADVVLPIIDLDQDGSWRPIDTPDRGSLWVRARWVFIAVGWVLASVFVAAFTTLVQRG